MTEGQLIQAAKKGATDCFSQLVARYQVRLYSYLLARCHNHHDADDVLQETFINAYRYLDSYNSQWAFSTWLFTIARRLLHQLKTMYHVALELVHPEATPPAELSLDSQNIWRLIKTELNPDSYDALWFYYMEEASIKDIAHIMGKSESWVKTNLHRSKMKLSHTPDLQGLLTE